MVGILSPKEIKSILKHSYIGTIACCSEGKPYAVPFTFYYDEDHECLISYTAEGKKIDMLRNNPNVCVSVSNIEDLANWKSLILEGTYQELEGLEAVEAIRLLITRLRTIINDEGVQKVDQIEDFARISHRNRKVIYKINISNASGRFEVKNT